MTNKSVTIQLNKLADEIEEAAKLCSPRHCVACKFQLKCAKVMRAAAEKLEKP